jgi:hypothetical protein
MIAPGDAYGSRIWLMAMWPVGEKNEETISADVAEH